MNINTNFTQINYMSKKRYVPPKCNVSNAEDAGLKIEDVFKENLGTNVKLGDKLNSGMNADVYYIQGWPNTYIARIERDYEKDFKPEKLAPAKENISGTVLESADGHLSISRQIKGEPLHGRDWRLGKSVNLETFWNTVEMLSKLPDKVYENYIDDVIKIREHGYDIDTWNPNNYLFDKESNRINIIDCISGFKKCEGLEMCDFYPFIDSRRLNLLIWDLNQEKREELAQTVIKFLDRMIGIAKKKGYNIEVEQLPKELLEHFYMNFATLLYRRSPIIFK